MAEIARSGMEYHEDMGAVLWWRFPIIEPPYVGAPLDQDWPGYHTHFTVLPERPIEPAPWWKGVRPWQLYDARQSGYHFFDLSPLSRRLAAYPGSTDETHALQQFARDHGDYFIPF